MSTLKVNKIENTATTDGGIEIDSDGHVQLDGVQLPTAGPLSNRNLIINGAMQIAQRATQETGITASKYSTVDRFTTVHNNLGTWTSDQSTDAPEGFSHSFKYTCTTADASPAADTYVLIQTRIEAQDLQHLKWGTANALPLTISFWVKSNKTGAASFGMYQPDASNRNASNSYTINAANTWEYKTLTFNGDQSGGFDNDNGIGLNVEWWLNGGSDYSGGGHQTDFAALDQTTRNASNLGVGGAVSDYFAITGVQLEVGDKATPFEHRSYDDELQRCQRYYQERTYLGGGIVTTGVSWSTATAACNIPTNSKMRVAPTVELPPAGSGSSVLAFLTSGGGYPTTIGTHTVSNISDTNITIYGASYAGLTDDGPSWVYAGATGGSITFKFSAEL